MANTTDAADTADTAYMADAIRQIRALCDPMDAKFDKIKAICDNAIRRTEMSHGREVKD